MFSKRFQNRLHNQFSLRVNYPIQFCSSKLDPENFRCSLFATDLALNSLAKWFHRTWGHCKTFSILETISCLANQYSAKVSQSQPLYQLTHYALYVCIETSASRRSSVSVIS